MAPGGRLAGAALTAAALVLAGCVSAGPDEAAVSRWHAAQRAAPYHATSIVFAGIVVADCSWARAPLGGWIQSRDLLDAAAGQWLGLPAARRLKLDNPNRETLRRFLAEDLPAVATADDLLVIYLGTHQLRDGRLLLAEGDSLRADELGELLRALPQRLVVLADLCYAARLETAVGWSDRVMRVYGAGALQEAPELRLRGTYPSVISFFATTDRIVRNELGQPADRYSLFGYLLVHSLIQVLAARPATVDTAAWWQALAAEYARLAGTATYYPVPTPAAANIQPWPLAQRLDP